MLGFACDFFVYDGSTCVFLPFLPIKSIGIHDIVKSASGNIGYMLHCSGSQENMVVNSDMSTFSEERKILKKTALYHDVRNVDELLLFQHGKLLIIAHPCS